MPKAPEIPGSIPGTTIREAGYTRVRHVAYIHAGATSACTKGRFVQREGEAEEAMNSRV